MNAKTSVRKTKAPAARASAKSASTVSSRKQPSASPASGKAHKSASVSHIKATSQSASVALPVPDNSGGQSKQIRLISLLQTKPGATIAQMMALTGWQAHTVRGTISGVLRKKLGLNVTCTPSTDSGARLYRIVGASTSA